MLISVTKQACRFFLVNKVRYKAKILGTVTWTSTQFLCRAYSVPFSLGHRKITSTAISISGENREPPEIHRVASKIWKALQVQLMLIYVYSLEKYLLSTYSVPDINSYQQQQKNDTQLFSSSSLALRYGSSVSLHHLQMYLVNALVQWPCFLNSRDKYWKL